MQCEVYRKNKEDTNEFKEDGKYSKMEVTTIDDVKNYVRYMSDNRCDLALSKLWASKQPMNGQTKNMSPARGPRIVQVSKLSKATKAGKASNQS